MADLDYDRAVIGLTMVVISSTVHGLKLLPVIDGDHHASWARVRPCI